MKASLFTFWKNEKWILKNVSLFAQEEEEFS